MGPQRHMFDLAVVTVDAIGFLAEAIVADLPATSVLRVIRTVTG